MHQSWLELLSPEFEKKYFKSLQRFLGQERSQYNIFPPEPKVFSAFDYPFHNVRALILGQDPYIGTHQAHGLSFSVLRPTLPPPSLKNIFKELATDIPGWKPPNHGDLTCWAENGVLLLNSVLTVREGKSNSHKGHGWEIFTNKVIRFLAERGDCVFILWGNQAKTKDYFILGSSARNVIISSVHPSPLSAYGGFFGSKPFSFTNKTLKSWGKEQIDWNIT